MRYVNIITRESVHEEDALDYVCEKCGINFVEVADNKEQLELKEALVYWYFSANWTQELEDENFEFVYED